MQIPKAAIKALQVSTLLLLVSCVAEAQNEVFGGRAKEAATGSIEDSQKIRLQFADGATITVDEAWESEQGIWYRQSGMSHLVSRAQVKAIHRNSGSTKADLNAAEVPAESKLASPTALIGQPVWIYLVGGARVEADTATESAEGVWYRRGSLTIFIERARIDRVERELPETNLADLNPKRERGWTTGNQRLDALIRQNGMKYGVDPYLIFCVMEQESHFNARALSPKGARGLMQLMPGTAARFGVKRPGDPAQNIAGGTRYLKQLIAQFDGRIDLVLASYNAGEGAVLKFGRKVPPYRETRDYVKKISYRYRRNKSTVFYKGELTNAAVRAGT
ncbi:MAG TPA: lytic transglycosylase domain-containing protein [Pyrinomonadaceae bacterium]|nr:lytic transglycosylase domain-containing protein [Pyrinomonadaceae bacterium]